MYIPVAVVDEVTEAPPPTSPVGTPTAWYDASDVASITTVSNLVSQWDDQMGSFNATQSTAGDRPAYDAAPRTINGVICPEFVTSDFLNAGFGRSTRVCSTFVVALSDSVAGSTALVSSSNTGGNEFRTSTNGQLATLKEGTSTLATMTAANITVASPFIAGQVLDATSITHYLMSSALISFSKQTTSDSTTFTAALTATIGRRITAAEGWDGLIAEILVYTSTLTESDVILNFSYLANKWAVAEA